MKRPRKLGFLLAVLCTFLVLLPDIATGYHFFGRYFPSWGTELKILGRLTGILLACLIVVRLNSLSFLKSLWFLGFKKPHGKQLLVGLLALVPVAIGYWLTYRECLRLGINVWPKQYDPFLFVFNLTYEEVLFRGFVYQCLRPGRSFGRAAFLSGVLFSLPHMGHLLHTGFSNDGLLAAGSSMVAAFLFSFPSAYVFERGGNVLWGYLLTHVGIDTINYLDGDRDANSPLVLAYVIGGIALSMALTFPLTNRFLPMRKGWDKPKRV